MYGYFNICLKLVSKQIRLSLLQCMGSTKANYISHVETELLPLV